MWALRRASNPIKNRAFTIRKFQDFRATSETINKYVESTNGTFDKSLPVKRFYPTPRESPKPFGLHTFSSQAGTETEDDDLEEGFSELETPSSTATTPNDEDLVTESELSGDEDNDLGDEPQNELDLSDSETEKKYRQRRSSSPLVKAIMAAPGLSVNSVLDKWVEEGKEISRAEIALAMIFFRKRRMYGRALQLSEWLESSKKLEFVERDYAGRLDLIAKMRGLHKAESYIEKIPKSFRGEVIYRTLLANCVVSFNAQKAEEVFNKMKDLQFPISSFACNQLLLLYKRTDKKKIADVLLLMEKENVKPSLFTYRILIDTKGQSNDITGMEQIVETMKNEGIEPDLYTQAILARHYVSSGLKEKAESVMKEMEGDDVKDSRWACRNLLPLYADIGKVNEVKRLWKICEQNPRLEECMAAIEAWGKLNNVPEAEKVFEKMSKSNKLSSVHYSTLLKVYANHKMLSKGKDLVKQMSENGCRIGPLTWDALVKLYVEAGEVEKADAILQKAAQQNNIKPMFNSYMTIMDKYAKRGDVHNAEKMFYRMRQVGYVARLRQYHTLLQAYINGKVPAYGIRERMQVDNVFPNKSMAGMLAMMDPFRKTAVSELLD